MAEAKLPPSSNPSSRTEQTPPQQASTPPRPSSPSISPDIDSSLTSSKKKKKKSKAKDLDLGNQGYDGQRSISPSGVSSTAQAQADLLATASDLYRRIEADPQGIPDDDAYWTSLPPHLRTFIRNALPLGQFPPPGQVALNGNPNDPNTRHASTQAMIAVAQQLAQAAHASQRHLQHFPPGTHPYPPLPFDPSIFADLALHPDQPLPLHPHPNAGGNGSSLPNGNHAAYSHGHVQYMTSSNPPPTQPPGEPLPAPVVLVNEFGEETGDYDDEYYSEDDLDHDVLDEHGNVISSNNGMWVHDDEDHVCGPNGALSAGLTTSSKNKKKKKKKKGASAASTNQSVGQTYNSVSPGQVINKLSRQQQQHSHPSSNPPVSSNVRTGSTQPPPSSRAAGKQPMMFSSTGKASARPSNGVPLPSSNAAGKRPATGSMHSNSHSHPKPPAPPARIWSTSSAEERERIKEFWLGLSERERQQLVKLEKETVLRKMKDQQKHGCSCAVCGRKRSAIEDELEVLYDAYYDELEEYANHQQRWASSGGTIPPPPGPGPFPGSVALDSNGAVIGGDQLRVRSHATRDGRHGHGHGHGQHHHGQHRGIKKSAAPLHSESSDGYDEDELDDEEFDDEDDEEFDDEEDSEEAELEREREREEAVVAGIKKAPAGGVGRRKPHPAGAQSGQNDLFALGSSLTVKGGILTVADDLLKNDGQKFLQMMEQLAERRMQREEEVGAELGISEDEDDDDPADDVDEDDLDDEEGEEDDIMTDEQRMEEGRRMFQIFAARMFEQRVLQAYREKVAQERQLQLLRELEEEDMNEKAKEAKRQKDNQKKKDKKKQQKEQKEAERIRREQERAAEEAAAKAKADKQREADLKKQEELRQKREAEKRAKEEEKAKREEEKRKRQAEERERERKKREKEDKIRLEKEAKEREIKQKQEEARKAQEAKEKVKRGKAEQKAREEQERKAEAARREATDKAAAVQANVRTSASPSRSSHSTTPAPSPAGARTSATPKSPGAAIQQAVGRVRNGSIPSSPSVGQNGMRSTGGSRALPIQRLAQVQGSGSSQGGQSSSTLPAPPQTLPPRPSSAVVNPSGHHQASQGSASLSVAVNVGLPRPPVNAGVAGASIPTLGFGSIAQSFGTSLATAAGSQPLPKQQATVSPKAPQTPSHVHTQQPSQFAYQQTAHSMPLSPPGSASVSRAHGAFGAGGFDKLRSPTMPNGVPVGMSMGGKSGLDSSGLQSPGLGLGHGVGAATNSLASLGLGTPPTARGSASVQQQDMLGHGMPGSSQTPGHARVGHGVEPLRSRATSMAESDHLLRSSSLSHRAMGRPAPPTPIGPIGRPRLGDMHLQEDTFGPARNGRSSSSASGSGPASPKLPEGILGSSALGGDDELIEPQPRRTSNTFPISVGGNGGSFFGMGGNSVGGAFGMSGGSPWSSFSGNAPSAPGGPLSPGFVNAAPGNTGSNPTNMGLTPGSGSGGGPIDPWARAQSSWDRARSAFEQPSSFPPLANQMLHGGGGGGGGNPVSPFGSAPRNLFGGVPGAPPHHGAIGSALSPTSPGSRHRHDQQ